MKYMKEEWLSAIPQRREALTEEDALLLSTLDCVVPVKSITGSTMEQVFGRWLDAGKQQGIVSGGQAAHLWKAYAAGEA